MKILIDEENRIYLTSDSNQFFISKLGERPNNKTGEIEEFFTNLGSYRTEKDALKGYHLKMRRNSQAEDWKTHNELVKSVDKKIDIIGKELGLNLDEVR